jgi:hypothetical protein
VTCTPNDRFAFDGGHCHGCTGSTPFGVGPKAIRIQRRQLRIHVGIDLILPLSAVHHQFTFPADEDDSGRSPARGSRRDLRARAILDMTVPIGIASTSAISLYFIACIAHQHCFKQPRQPLGRVLQGFTGG